MTDQRRDNSRHIRARRGSEIKAKHWTTEAAVRMLMNNLDDEVAEDPQSLVVYGGIGRAARNWQCFDKIVETLERLEEDQTLLVPEPLQRLDDLVVAIPIASRPPDASIDDEALRILGDFVVEIVHQHAHRGFGAPALRLDLVAAAGTDVA